MADLDPAEPTEVTGFDDEYVVVALFKLVAVGGRLSQRPLPGTPIRAINLEKDIRVCSSPAFVTCRDSDRVLHEFDGACDQLPVRRKFADDFSIIIRSTEPPDGWSST